MKYEKKFYIIEIKIVIIFKINLNLKKIEFKIEKLKLNFNASFIIKFKLINVNEIYEIYYKINYIIYNYEIIINLKLFEKIKFFLLKNKFFIS